jgi:guanine nucleotide-binding protein subunit alpha-13
MLKEGAQNPAQFLNKASATGIARLWRDTTIQQALERRTEFQLPGSVDYLLDNAERLLDLRAQIEDKDILHARQATTGISEVQFELDRTIFRVMDVGGQRSERRKWYEK